MTYVYTESSETSSNIIYLTTLYTVESDEI